MLPYLMGRFGNPSATYGLARRPRRRSTTRARRSHRAGCRSSDIVSPAAAPSRSTRRSRAWPSPRRRRAPATTSSPPRSSTTPCSTPATTSSSSASRSPTCPSTARPRRSRRGRARGHGPHRPRLRHAGEQRGRHHPADRRGRESVVGERGPAPAQRIPVHTDAVQAPAPCRSTSSAGRRPAQPLRPQVRRAEGHRRALPPPRHALVSQLSGGGQERQRRAGTENVAGIVGQARALTHRRRRRETNVAATRRCATG